MVSRSVLRRQWALVTTSTGLVALVACTTTPTTTTPSGEQRERVTFVPSCGKAGDVVEVKLFYPAAKGGGCPIGETRIAFQPGEQVAPKSGAATGQTSDGAECTYAVTVPESARTGTVDVIKSENNRGPDPLGNDYYARYTSLDVFTVPCPPDAGPDADPGMPSNPIVDAFCPAAYGVVADKVNSCCPPADKSKPAAQTLVGGTQGPLATCKKYITISAGQGRIEVNVAEMTTCKAYADAIGAAPCYEGLVTTRYITDQRVPDACRGAIAGKQARGAPCGNAYECATGDRCVGYQHTTSGIIEGTCQAPGANGTPCTANIPALKRLGHHPECEPGHVCNASGMCVPGIANGQGCTTDVQCESGICSNFQCVAALLGQGATCTSRLDCEPQYQCSTGTCQPDKAATTACTASPPQCRGLCESNACVSFCGSN